MPDQTSGLSQLPAMSPAIRTLSYPRHTPDTYSAVCLPSIVYALSFRVLKR